MTHVQWRFILGLCPDTICYAICPVCCTEIKYVYHTEFGYLFYLYSSIHDHTDSHCFMKILQGNLKETLFEWPEKKGNGEMIKKSERVLRENQCAYINDSIGLHRVENISHTESAVSLHLYSPPFDSCNTFDQRTGHKHKVKMTFYSQFGERTLCATAVPQENN
uniref:Cysteine dioxygenase n=1 Tax=Buteo japonicus TaxID=224669 RepID=A0A8C0HQA0_9AVES